MSRFFKKSKNIDSLTTKEITEFLHTEDLARRVVPSRVEDFYNALSTLSEEGNLEREDVVDYNQFECKRQEDYNKIDELRNKEEGWLENISKEFLTGNRLLKTAAALAHRFEKEIKEEAVYGPPDPNSYLRDLFACEDDQGEGDGVKFGDLLEQDVTFMKYISLLSKKKAFARDLGKLEEDPNGKTVKYRMMNGMAEVINMDLIQSVMPDFKRKLATEDLYVKKRFVRNDRAQNLIIMIDDSGSMSSALKKAMLKAAISLKLRDHVEAHNVYIGTFILENFGFYKVKKGDIFEDLDFILLNKGTTDVNACVMDTISQVKKRRLKSFRGDDHILSDDHFEIMVINDGDDRVDPSYHPTIKLHAICLCQSNPNLKNICHRSGGTYHYLSGRE